MSDDAEQKDPGRKILGITGHENENHTNMNYMVVSKNRGTLLAGWFIMDNPINMDVLEVPLFQETSI